MRYPEAHTAEISAPRPIPEPITKNEGRKDVQEKSQIATSHIVSDAMEPQKEQSPPPPPPPPPEQDTMA